MTDAVRAVVGQLADADRRRVLAAVELGATDLAGIAASAGIPEHRINKALARLVDSGLVANTTGGFTIAAGRFADAARELLSRPESTEHDERPDDQRRVFAAFVRDGRITSIPTSRAKRRVLLDWLVQRIEPGRRYLEREINEILAEYDDDVATWRRYLVDEEFIGRTSDGVYWRIGGTFAVADC